MLRRSAVSAAFVAVTAVLSAAGVPQQKAPFCADAGHQAAPARLLPVDEAAKQPEFFTYRARLQVAVAAKDVDSILAASDPNIKLGFGGEGGTESMKQNLSKPDSDELWKELARVLALGGSFRSPSAFHAPYYASNWPEVVDSFECGAIVGASVLVRRDPKPDSPIITRASYAIVRVLGDLPGAHGWSHIRLASGQEGYVRDDFLRGPTFLRATFNVIQGQWRMTALVAGD